MDKNPKIHTFKIINTEHIKRKIDKKLFLFLSSTLDDSSQPPVQWVPGLFPIGKVAKVWC